MKLIDFLEYNQVYDILRLGNCVPKFIPLEDFDDFFETLWYDYLGRANYRGDIYSIIQSQLVRTYGKDIVDIEAAKQVANEIEKMLPEPTSNCYTDEWVEAWEEDNV